MIVAKAPVEERSLVDAYSIEANSSWTDNVAVRLETDCDAACPRAKGPRSKGDPDGARLARGNRVWTAIRHVEVAGIIDGRDS